MKTIVMGGGVVGVTTAYFLAKEGHEVTVIERQPDAAQETSFQNVGLLAAAHASAWASPRAPMILLQSLWQKDAALIFRWRLDPRMWAWSLQFLKNCTSERFKVNTVRKLKICQYSQQVMKEIRAETGITFDDLHEGLLYVYRDPAHFDQAASALKLLTDNGLELERKDHDQVARIEPALEPVKDKIVGGFYCPTDESGDTCTFTRNLARICDGKGVAFKFDTNVTALKADSDRVEAVVTDKGEF